MNEKGETIKMMAWTDTMKAENPEISGDRAQVSTTDVMTFEGGKAPPFEVRGKEGYILTKDGGLGDYCTENMGQVQRMVKLSDNAWSAAAPASEQELVRLGFPPGRPASTCWSKSSPGKRVLKRIESVASQQQVGRTRTARSRQFSS